MVACYSSKRKLIHRFNEIPTKIPARFLLDIDELILSLYEKAKKIE